MNKLLGFAFASMSLIASVASADVRIERKHEPNTIVNDSVYLTNTDAKNDILVTASVVFWNRTDRTPVVSQVFVPAGATRFVGWFHPFDKIEILAHHNSK